MYQPFYKDNIRKDKAWHLIVVVLGVEGENIRFRIITWSRDLAWIRLARKAALRRYAPAGEWRRAEFAAVPRHSRFAGMHAIARFSSESVRLSGVSATGNSFSRVSGESNGERDERRNKPVRFVHRKDSFIRTGSQTNEPTRPRWKSGVRLFEMRVSAASDRLELLRWKDSTSVVSMISFSRGRKKKERKS